MLKKTFLLLVGLAMTFAVQAQDFLGAWSGKLDLRTAKLSLVFYFSKDDSGKLKCVMDSPDQGANGIPAEAEVTAEGKVRVTVSALGISYEAQVSDKRMEGTFNQGAVSLPLVLEPGEAKHNRPQTPTPPYMYPTEEVTFTNPADGAKLAGTLTYPMNFQFSKDVPVLVMVTGSGQQNRDEELFDHRPFLVIADYLAKQGIATLRYDDRGVGGSTGEVANATTLDFMGDALAALDYVRSTGKFGKCGVLGHSEGGTIAMMIAGRQQCDFVVSLAGMAIKGDSLLLLQNHAALSKSGVPAMVCDDYVTALRQLLRWMESGEQVPNPKERIAEFVKSANLQLPEALVENLAKVMEASSPWLRAFLSLDPTEDIREASCPVLALNGGNDTQVTAKENLGAFRQLLPANEKNLVKEYPGLNHLFQHSQSGLPIEYGTIEETISPEVLQDIATWVNSVK